MLFAIRHSNFKWLWPSSVANEMHVHLETSSFVADLWPIKLHLTLRLTAAHLSARISKFPRSQL